jgi:hypothetical protein
MAKRNLNWTDDKFQRYIKEGRGSGEGKEYKPWLIIQDYPSMGIATRVMGYKTNRMHHFFSNVQLQYFYLLEWDNNVHDIRENYPLLDLRDVIKEKESDLRLDKFIDKESKIPFIITTTFLITLNNYGNNQMYAARSIKYSSELSKKSTLEKLEIERRYWKEKGIDWAIVTNKEINNVKAKNIEWLHSSMLKNKNDYSNKDEYLELRDSLLYRLTNNREMSISKVMINFEEDYGLQKGNGLALFKELLAEKIVSVDMNKAINLNEKCISLIYNKDWR